MRQNLIQRQIFRLAAKRTFSQPLKKRLLNSEVATNESDQQVFQGAKSNSGKRNSKYKSRGAKQVILEVKSSDWIANSNDPGASSNNQGAELSGQKEKLSDRGAKLRGRGVNSNGQGKNRAEKR